MLKVRPQGEGEVKGAVTVKSSEDTRMSESNKNSPEDRQKKQRSSVCDSSISTNINKDDTHDTSILVSEVTKCDDGVEEPDGKKVAVATPYPGRKKVSLLSEESEEFRELKIDLTQTKKDRSKEEVEKLLKVMK